MTVPDALSTSILNFVRPGFGKSTYPVVANLFTCTNAGLRQAQKRERETNHLRAARATGYNGLEASNTVSLLITL